MHKLGLLGKNISYSFSKTYFTEKFLKGDLPYTYENFDIDSISKLPSILKNNPDLIGLNVTIPYKEQVIPYLDNISKKAKDIGAVNTISISKSGLMKGYNTDSHGFKHSIEPLLKAHHKTALILGTGGASKAVAHTFKELDIDFDYVSRSPNAMAKYVYDDLTPEIINSYKIIINCSPVGTYPNINQCPNIPYDGVSRDHLLYDLIYNPLQTKFLACGELQGAMTSNGLQMLELQAEKAWDIWTLA